MVKRIFRLVEHKILTKEDAALFLSLETLILSRDLPTDWLNAFHITNDVYRPLLERVLRGLCVLGEPYASEKLKEFNRELGIQSPGLYMTPWELTLTDLDKEIGKPGGH